MDLEEFFDDLRNYEDHVMSEIFFNKETKVYTFPCIKQIVSMLLPHYNIITRKINNLREEDRHLHFVKEIANDICEGIEIEHVDVIRIEYKDFEDFKTDYINATKNFDEHFAKNCIQSLFLDGIDWCIYDSQTEHYIYDYIIRSLNRKTVT
jgi:histidinol phosphatase-like PHP family hydrolase